MQVDIMRAAGLQDDEIKRLTILKQRVEAGQRSELTSEYKRLLFFRFLQTSGRLHDGRMSVPTRESSNAKER